MLRFSKKAEYALIAMVHIAKKTDDELTTARELSDKFDISLELMGKLLQTLVRHNLIASIQGVKGGYYLNKPMSDISIRSIVTAVDGPVEITTCRENDGTTKCKREKICNIRESIIGIQSALENFFNNLTLKDFKEKRIDLS